jgi:tRNA nucleotidyltransferase (CCA-adding enzyme)
MITEAQHNCGMEPVRSFLKQLFPAEVSRQVWLVGGSVRDMLLGREIRDIDLVAALPADLLESRGFRPVIAKSAAAVWFRHFSGFGNVEITLIDREEELLSDLKRRDFTVNAILMSIDGVLNDPLQGRDDLKNLTLRSCSENSFSADPLRIFRAFRLESEGFRIASETGQLILAKSWDEELLRIPAERFAREMLKSFSAAEPWRFFQKMLEFGAGRSWLPELFRMPEVPAGPLVHHPEGDLLSHSVQVLERVASETGSPLARFCAFFHDIGKLSTEPSLYPKHHGHDEAGFSVAEGFCRRLSLPVAYGRALALISRLHGNANRFDELRLSTRIRMAEQAIRGGVADILPLVSKADKPGNGCMGGWERALAVARMTTAELGIDPQAMDLLEPSKRSGLVLQKRVEALRSS